MITISCPYQLFKSKQRKNFVPTPNMNYESATFLDHVRVVPDLPKDLAQDMLERRNKIHKAESNK